jgi:PHS family inorganic phosphate transporter-like MFS transporter
MAISTEQASRNEREQVKKETWGEYWRGFWEFLFTEEWRDRQIRDGPWTRGHWRDLAGTSLTWMLLDFSFYFLGIYDPAILSILWKSPKSTSVYTMLIQYGWQGLISNSIGAIIGGAIFVAMARYRYNIQFFGFLILTALFVVVGVTFLTLSNGRYFAAIIVFYGLCRLFFNFGKAPQLNFSV